MNFDRVYELVQYLPEDSEYFSGPNALSSVESNNELDVRKFLLAYKDLMFGYRFVKSLVKAKKKLPLVVKEKSLKNLYKFETRKHKDRNIIHALALRDKSNKFYRNTLESLFLADDATYKVIAEKTGIKKEVVYLYEQLFFNVMDRKDDFAFIAETVYPEHRFVEFEDNYTKNESSNFLLKRSSYNNGIDDVLHLAGFKSENNIDANNVTENANRLESTILSNGYYLARNGYLNQRSSTGINNAKNIIAATKQGGGEALDEDTDGIANSDIGSIFMEDAVSGSKQELEGMLEKRSNAFANDEKQ